MTDRASGETGLDGLEAVCRSVRRLISSTHGPLRRMRVQVGEVAVDVEWPVTTGAPVAGVPGTAAAVPLPTGGPEAGVAPEAAPVLTEPDSELHHVHAPGVGTFYRAPRTGADPFVKEGDQVAPGQQIGVLEVMKLMIPIEADRAGRVAAIFVENGHSVEFGQALIALELE